MEDVPTILLILAPVVGIVSLVGLLWVVGFANNAGPGIKELPPEGLRGRMLASWSPGGRIGIINYTIGMLKLELHEFGMIYRPLIGRGHWIAREDITEIIYGSPGTMGTLGKGSILRANGGELVLWNNRQRHSELVEWWRPGAHADAD